MTRKAAYETGLAKVAVQFSADQPRLMVNPKFGSPYQSASADLKSSFMVKVPPFG